MPSLFSTKGQEQLNGGKEVFSKWCRGKVEFLGQKKEKEIPPKSHTVDKDEPKTDFGLE